MEGRTQLVTAQSEKAETSLWGQRTGRTVEDDNDKGNRVGQNSTHYHNKPTHRKTQYT